MPTYEYVCEKCGHQFDQFQPISAKPLRICPEHVCQQKRWGKGKVKRVIGAGAGLIFKGSGFYSTDYRSENYKQAAKKEKAPAAAGTESKPATADAKPAATKPESKPAKSEAAKS